MDMIACKGCRTNMVPWDKPDSLCPSCRDLNRQQRALGKMCSVCHFEPPWMNIGDKCFGCRLHEAAQKTPRKRWWR